VKFSNIAQLLRGRADDQPRVPKGQHGGGQWTRLGDLANSASAFSDRAQENADSSSADDRPEGWQLVRDTTNFPVLVRPRPLSPGLTPWLMAFNHASGRNERGVRQTFIEFSKQDDGTWAFSKLDEFTEDRFNERCKKLDTAYNVAEGAAKQVHDEGQQLNQPGYGTAVHVKAKEIVDKGKTRGDPEFRGLDAELTIWDANNPLRRLERESTKGADAAIPYGTKGTIRTDLIEDLGHGTACVYDIKTGREPLRPFRIEQITKSVAEHYQREGKLLTNIFITTVHIPLQPR